MPPGPLSAEERALWRRVTRDVRPLADAVAEPDDFGAPAPRATTGAPRPDASPVLLSRFDASPGTLDGGWDRKLQRGLAAPDMTIDLHGHSLASAHRTLAAALERAVAGHVRLLLIITGRPPRGGSPRGAIRAAIGDWLGSLPDAARIAAVRKAHPRHGGAGALYVVLRRPNLQRGKRIP